jgi:hypothetical protein
MMILVMMSVSDSPSQMIAIWQLAQVSLNCLALLMFVRIIPLAQQNCAFFRLIKHFPGSWRGCCQISIVILLEILKHLIFVRVYSAAEDICGRVWDMVSMFISEGLINETPRVFSLYYLMLCQNFEIFHVIFLGSSCGHEIATLLCSNLKQVTRVNVL